MSRIQYKHWLIFPAVLAMLIVAVFPLIYSMGTSLSLYMLNRPDLRSFYWFNNYKEVLLDPRIRSTLLVTIRFAAAALTIELVIGYILAVCLTRIKYLRNIVISVLMVPMMISPIAVGLIWRLLLHPDLGIVNYILDTIGIGGRPWLSLPSTALLTIVFIEVWQWTPFVMILIFAGIISMPEEPFEAATIDGANSWQKFFFLSLPFLRNVLVLTATLRLIDLVKTYDLIFILTRGGPGSSTETFAYYIYYLGFMKLNLGQASAASFLFVIVVVIVTAFLLNRIRQSQYE